jgi:hypothetical protein
MSSDSKEIQGSIFTFLGKLFKKHNITSVIVGGYALILNKVQRMTFDIDFMLTQEDCEKIEPDLLDVGYTVLSRQQAFLQLSSKKKGLRDLDFLITDKKTLNIIITEGKKTIIAGQEFTFPSPKHLIMMKIHSISENKKREIKDLPDIVQLLEANSIDPSSREIKEMFEKSNEKNLYKRVLDLMGRK